MNDFPDMPRMVMVSGVVNSSNFISVPYEWKDMVNPDSITVSLTKLGAHQDVIVKRVSLEEVLLQSRPGIPIRCFYQLFAEVKDNYEPPEEVD